MFWRMTGLSTASPVDTILDKENYTLEELLDEDEIIQECKALNTRLINFLRERTQVEQLLRYIVEEAPEDVEKKRTFKFPFIACEIFTCEVDIILRTLVEDEKLMDLLFSFLKPDHQHSTLLAGYFSKVVICLMLRKTTPLMNYVKDHQEIFCQLVDLIGITSIMEVLIRLIGADENMYSNYTEPIPWLEETNVLEMIVDKFSSSDSPEVHANAAEVLCAITRNAPPGLATKICSPSFVGRLLRHALEDSRPKSVLVHSLTVCMSLLDPKRLVTSTYQSFRSQFSHGSLTTANPEMVDGMLESLGDLLKLLDVSSSETILPTTYGSLQPPLGKHRLKIVDFISVLLTIGSEAAEKELIRLGAIQRILDMFFEYPFNNFLHHYVENIIGSCLESKRTVLVEHLFHECQVVGKILAAEKQSTLITDCNKPTVSAQGRSPPRIGNVGHLTRIANKIIQFGNNNNIIQAHLQENTEWVDWHTNILIKRNAVENIYQWACGRPTSLHDRNRDSDDEDFRDRDYDVATLANNLSQAFRYGIYSNDDIEEAHGSLERDDEDVYFDDESAEVVISSLRLGDDQDSSLFTNSNWFAFEDDRNANDHTAGSLASPSSNVDETNDVTVGENEDLVDTATSLELSGPSDPVTNSNVTETSVLENGPVENSENGAEPSSSSKETEEEPKWVEWRETSDSGNIPNEKPTPDVSNVAEAENQEDQALSDVSNCEPPESTNLASEAVPESSNESHSTNSSEFEKEPISTGPNSSPSIGTSAVGDINHDKETVGTDPK
ncbi:serine/threonine-protein phosphatase 6 regulatory subunit 3-like isoform X2 [Asparagus officinalis]|uniref:serine/threonine-protein phosphatase 6 regulatory subunit 3-like isoform X2 n=1 Tax=Asparagus officinalis TaxID=4686 RepID=UPI00098E60BF|nr:serine/threonine-protein phosphatase 6 regulatory subunit 3-like isoform X2 [Asparagus officinalis]